MILTLENRGTSRHPRYVLMNSYGWCWDNDREEFVEGDGTLFHDVNSACQQMREILLAENGNKRKRRFTAPITLELYCDQHVAQQTIEDWCLKATRLILHADQHGMGPVNDSLGLVSVDWSKLTETASPSD